MMRFYGVKRNMRLGTKLHSDCLLIIYTFKRCKVEDIDM